MPRPKRTKRAVQLELPPALPPSECREREAEWQKDGVDGKAGPAMWPNLEYGGDLDEIAAKIQFVRVEARGQQALITLGIVASALIATLEHGQLPGLAAMGALTLLALVQYFKPQSGRWQGQKPEAPPRRRTAPLASQAMRS